jgi:hypothetical protein
MHCWLERIKTGETIFMEGLRCRWRTHSNQWFMTIYGNRCQCSVTSSDGYCIWNLKLSGIVYEDEVTGVVCVNGEQASVCDACEESSYKYDMCWLSFWCETTCRCAKLFELRFLRYYSGYL